MLATLMNFVHELGDVLLTAEIAVVIAGGIIYALSMYKLSRSFGHGIPCAIGLILLQPLFTMILGFGASTWQGGMVRPDEMGG